MSGLAPLQRRSDAARGAAAEPHAGAGGLAQALNAAPHVAQLAGLGRTLNAPKPARVAVPVIQGYTLEAPVAGNAVLRSQAPEPRIRKPAGGGRQLYYPRQQKAAQAATFRVSDDGAMAIHATTDEPKEFFAFNRVVAASNAALAAVHSSVRLAKGAGQVRFGPALMGAVVPVPVEPDPNAVGDFPDLWSHICISLTNSITGNEGNSREEIVLHDAASGARGAMVASPGGKFSARVDQLAANLTETPAMAGNAQGRIGHALANVSDDDPDDYAGRAYGLASHQGAVDPQARQLGANQFARPDVGEGFATFSIRPAGGGTTDFATAGAKRKRPNAWGYHHAAVVARSGGDWVTLENYNRTPQVQDTAAAEVHRRYQQEAAARLKQLQTAARREGRPLSLAQARSDVAHYLRNEHPQASAYYLNLATQHGVSGEALWFFRMYGSKRGQSFHEEQAASGAYFNPLTVRVRRDMVRLLRNKVADTRHALDNRIAAVHWPAAQAGLNLLTNEIAVDFPAMIGVLDALAETRTEAAQTAALDQVHNDYATFLAHSLVPRMTAALTATRNGPLGAVPATLPQLKVQAALPDTLPAPTGFWTRMVGTRANPVQVAALTALRTAIDGVPGAL